MWMFLWMLNKIKMIKFIVTAILILAGFFCKIMTLENKNASSVRTVTEIILKQ
jgi:hypothetical protein